ncbi:CATRA conflict system CASPASE/TPR repeat-associated protein [Catenuloplanes japonicus]|uniref:CATRA conflict system CASPASE/TPR repeat-associated protein n=1 Tax=Catenuloplanes japonicus TaxID=33876 RepID=UPI0012FB1BED|nr:CATRA conflict system CASPASE/TPR repeat-associated protein [Catenuloplanes japonicus]
MTSLVLHAFAPLDGPAAPLALHQLRALWAACGEVLEMHTPLAAGLPVEPRDWRGERRVGALAARRRDEFRAVLRRDRDVLILSAALPGVGDAGWVELDRWLDTVAAGGVDALIGLCRIYRMPAADPSFPPDRAALPDFLTHAGWQDDRVRLGRQACAWEMSPRQDTRRERRLVVAGADLDALTWGPTGDDALPPLGRYLMHAAVLRYQYRLWTGDQRRIGALRADRPGRDLLRADLARLHSMHATSDTSTRALADAARAAGMRGDGGPDPVTDDREFGRWLTRQLEDARSGVENLLRADGKPDDDLFGPLPDAAVPPRAGDPPSRVPPRSTAPRSAPARASRPPGASGRPPGNDPPPGRPSPGDSQPGRRPHESAREGARPHSWWQAEGTEPDTRPRATRHALRMSFTVDAVGYSGNDLAGRDLVQRRISDVVVQALDDLHLDLTDTDHQGTGDGINVVLPADLDLPRALADLLHGTAGALREDSRRYTAPLRLRMGASIGRFRIAALGWSDSTVIETNRLCDSAPVRTAMKDDPALLLAAMISDRLYPFTVEEGHPKLPPADFTQTDVTVKAYQGRAWLWSPRV